MANIWKIIKGYLSAKIENKKIIEIPKILVQAFGFPQKMKNFGNTNFARLISSIDPGLKELPHPFDFLNAFEALILNSKDPLKILDAADYEQFKRLQKAKKVFSQGDA